MSDPLAGFVRLLTPNGYNPATGYYDGEFRVTFPAIPTPPGDGTIYELDFVVPIPDGSGDVLGMWVYAGPPAFPLTEWTFDSRDPAFFPDYGFGGFRFDPASPPSWWTDSVVNLSSFDDTWAGPFDLGFSMALDPGSATDWWAPKPRVVTWGLTRDGSRIRSAVRGSGVRWQDPKSDVGSGQVVLTGDEGAAFHYGDVVRFSIDGTDRFGMVVEQREKAIVAQGEEADEIVTVSGRGTVAVYEEIVVAPEGGAAAGRMDQARYFNFASPLLDASAWTAPLVSGPRSHPEGWPDPGAQWVWTQDPLTIPVPAGDIYLRRAVHLGADTILEVWCAVDDGYELWWDGQKLFEDTLDSAWTGVAKNQKFFARAGDHVLAIHARNNNALLAGIFCTLLTKDANDSITGVLLHTEAQAGWPTGSWQVLAYPAVPPGFTPRKVWQILIAEAMARGADLRSWNNQPTIAMDPVGDLDHNGVPWPVVSDISVQVGQDLLSVLHQLAETYLDFNVDYTNYPGILDIGWLKMYVHEGTATAVALTPGTNLASLDSDGRV